MSMPKSLEKYEGEVLKSGKIRTPAFRVSFPNVFEPKPGPDGKNPKYRMTLLFPKDTDLSVLKEAVKDVIEERWGKKVPKGLRNPIRDGDEKALDGYADHFFLNVTSLQPPQIVQSDEHGRVPIDNGNQDPDGFYAGCYARCTLTVYAYDKAGNRGVAFGLGNIQKLEEGEPFSGRSSAADDFGKPEEGAASDYEEDDGGDPFDN